MKNGASVGWRPQFGDVVCPLVMWCCHKPSAERMCHSCVGPTRQWPLVLTTAPEASARSTRASHRANHENRRTANLAEGRADSPPYTLERARRYRFYSLHNSFSLHELLASTEVFSIVRSKKPGLETNSDRRKGVPRSNHFHDVLNHVANEQPR